MIGGNAAIAVLGPAETTEAGQRAASLAEHIGRELARQGYHVITEGDGATAQGAIRGALDGGGSITTVVWTGADDVQRPTVEIAREANGLRGLARTLEMADALILLPGDLRAAATLVQIWLYGLTRDAPYRQTVMVGDGGPEMVANLANALALDARVRAMVTFAKEPREAVETLRYYISGRS